MKSTRAWIVLGNQLLRDHPALEADTSEPIIMIEADDLCRKLPYHKHKLVLILSAMRHYRQYLESRGRTVYYVELGDHSFTGALTRLLKELSVEHLSWMEASDRPANQVLVTVSDRLGISHQSFENRQFITPPDMFDSWFGSQKKPLMENFYRWQRKRTGIMMDGDAPEGSRWNYDNENRQPLPKQVGAPRLVTVKTDAITDEVIKLVDNRFTTNPGQATEFWLPVDHIGADAWLQDFVDQRLYAFGTYEDAMRAGEPFLFHSVLSPLINCGLLSIWDVVQAVLEADVPVNSKEGIIRQLIGWREYMYGMYRSMPDLLSANYFGFRKQLEPWWYDKSYSSQQLPLPLQTVLKTVHQYGYNHHIERLMVLGNWFLVNEYDPSSVYKWFSSMYVDAYEWVMVPNVLGMSQYADGGVIATKPYISGGNYLQKMGNWWPTAAAAKESDYTKLYWQFLTRNYDKLKSNHRLAIPLRQAISRQD